MKKKLMVIAVIMMGLWLCSDVTLAKFKGHYFKKFFNNFVDEEVVLMYQEDTGAIYMQMDVDGVKTEITVADEYQEQLYELIRDYEKMQRRAESWEETYDKELGTLPTAESRFFKGTTWYHSKVNTAVNFFSQNLEWHQLIIFFSEMHDLEHENIHRDQFGLYFWGDEIRELKKVFSKRAFRDYKKQGEKDKE